MMSSNQNKIDRVVATTSHYIDIGLMLQQIRIHDTMQMKRIALSSNQISALLEAAALFVQGRTQCAPKSDTELVKTLAFGGHFDRAHIAAFTPDQLLSAIPADLLNRYRHIMEVPHEL